ncbi:MAG: type II toxin-antitoxin system HicA family toxin [Planctomycetes bacterium]|nr:type II toxin-antitoxin system HicA family toxin [Planctomycetota bacterium]MBI3846941.1 type II toxin-antitoxin system HicA family toxin [Planctomycetota bacterium]
MSDRLPALKPRRVIAILHRAGFLLHHIRGSHHFLMHPRKSGLLVCVPLHNRDLDRKTLRSIIEQAGFTPAEFLKLI